MKIVYSSKHQRHFPLSHLQEYGNEEYPEIPKRVEIIKSTLTQNHFGEFEEPSHYDETILREIHSNEYINYLISLKNIISDDGYHIPTTFSNTPEKKDIHSLGYFSSDLSAPVNNDIFEEASISLSCAHTATDLLLKGEHITFSLSRPPGHHAMKNKMGGFCYLNNTAYSAQLLSKHGRVAILDVDEHHGNGTQDIFYERNDVFTLSLHADPKGFYPFHWGFEDELGAGKGRGYNLNIPLPPQTNNATYQPHLEKAIHTIAQFDPSYLVVALGFDTYEKDTLGNFLLTSEYYSTMAKTIATLKKPTVFILEGGYYLPDLGTNTLTFLHHFV
ncbi:MAG: histone deacetylase family protein [Candidatus Roizmanbacteria bacterium]